MKLLLSFRLVKISYGKNLSYLDYSKCCLLMMQRSPALFFALRHRRQRYPLLYIPLKNSI